MLTIAQIIPEMHSGGVERGTLEVADELVRRGHRSLVISGGGRMVEQLEAGGSRHIELPVGRKSPLTVALAPKLRRLLRRERVDVLHARSRVPAWLSVIALAGLGRSRPAFLTTVHGLYSVNRWSGVMTRGDRVICVSRTVEDYVKQNYRVDEERLSLIYRGVDPTEYPQGYQPSEDWQRQFRSEYGLGSGPFITLPGRLTRLKGHHDFLELMTGLQETHPAVTGLIVGGEDPRRRAYAEEIRAAIAQRSLRNVVMTGHRSDLREILAMSALVLSLSTSPESFGRTVLEALTLGRPVVGYAHGGVGEVLERLFPPGRVPLGDATALLQTARQLLSEAPTVAPAPVFTLQAMLDGIIELYEEVGTCLRRFSAAA